MNNKEMVFWLALGSVVGLVIPMDICASQVQDIYGAKEIMKVGGNLKTFMFDVVVPYVAFAFGGVQTVRSLASNNYQSMGAYGLLTASSFVMPAFLGGVFGNSMLIP